VVAIVAVVVETAAVAIARARHISAALTLARKEPPRVGASPLTGVTTSIMKRMMRKITMNPGTILATTTNSNRLSITNLHSKPAEVKGVEEIVEEAAAVVAVRDAVVRVAVSNR